VAAKPLNLYQVGDVVVLQESLTHFSMRDKLFRFFFLFSAFFGISSMGFFLHQN